MIACQLAYVCAISKMRLLETTHNFPEDSKQGIYQRQIKSYSGFMGSGPLPGYKALYRETGGVRDKSWKGRTINLEKTVWSMRTCKAPTGIRRFAFSFLLSICQKSSWIAQSLQKL